MIDEELYKELQVTYYDLQSYLLNKYGPVKYDYFANAECRSRSKKISRTNEGLYCHHMDEDKGANLSDPISAQRQPYEWQKKDRLVYCNVLEHLILHIKIAVLRQKKMLSDTKAIDDFFTTGGIFELCLAINELFEKGESNSGWRKACYEKIKKNYEDYILLLQTVIMYIDKCYLNEKRSRCLKVGACVSISNENYEIVGITKKRDKVLLKHQLGGEKVYPVYLLESQLEYTDHIDMVISKMASMYEGFCDNVYFDIQKYQGKETAAEFAKILDVDFAGFGFARFINFKLAEYYGAENADEYIANAFPTYCSETDDLNNKHPRFWRGANIPIQAKDSFYIVRIETMFSVKKGCAPFVRYKKQDMLRPGTCSREITNQNNLLNNNGIILSTSDIFDPKTNTYYSQYRNVHGKIVDATVILTMTSEDFRMFKECYDIRFLKILDGCYFVEAMQ